MQVIIVGGGIAGLSAALSLHQIGVDCRIYESVPKLEPLGHGINLQPNAVRELSALGLGEKLASVGVLTAELAFYNKHGQLIWTEPRGKAASYHWPQISISRGKLQEVLLAAITERLGARALATGHQLTSLQERGGKVVAHFSDPSGQPAGEAEGDLLIGADGIHSAVRKQFYPGEAAVFDGYLHYRGIVEGDPYLSGRSMVVVGHRTHRAIIYPVAALPAGKVMIKPIRRSRAVRRRSRPGTRLPTRRSRSKAIGAGPIPGSTSKACSRAPSGCCSCRTSIAIRSRARVFRASRSSAMPRIRCSRWGHRPVHKRSTAACWRPR